MLRISALLKLLQYGIRRLGYAVFVVWGTFTITFALLYLLPSDLISMKLSLDNASGSMSPLARNSEAIAALNSRYGFDQPVLVQYGLVLKNFVARDLGTSINTGVPVSATVRLALPQTAQLGGTALLLSVVAGC